MYSVGLVLNHETAKALIGLKPVNDCIIPATFQSILVRAMVVQVYTPTEEFDDADKDAFYGQLQDVMNDILNHNVKLVIRDMNAKIDNRRHSLEHVIGPQRSVSESNDNRE